MAFKIDAFLALSSATMAEGSEGLTEADRSIISRCVEAAYREAAESGRDPLLGDFYRILKRQPEPEARDVALRYERYVEGACRFSTTPPTSASRGASPTSTSRTSPRTCAPSAS